MITNLITEDNLNEYEDFLPDDVSENIRRTTYYGLAFQDEDGNVDSAVIWYLRDYEVKSKDTTSHVDWIGALSEASGEAVMDEYGNMMKVAGTKKSFAQIPKNDDSKRVTDILGYAGFDPSDKEGMNLVVTVGKLKELDIVKKARTPSYLKPINTLLARTFRRGVMNCVVHSGRRLLDDLTTLPMEWFDPEVSCYVEADDRIDGLLLVHKLPSGKLRVECMCAFGPDLKKDMAYMMRFAILQAARLYPDDTEVIIPRRDESTKQLAGYLFPNAAGEKCICGERDEA